MKLTIEKNGSIVKAIKAEYTPAEATVILYAMRRFATDKEMSEKNRKLMQQMLDVEPVEEEEGEV